MRSSDDYSRRYVPRPEGRAALDKAIEIARERNERLLAINVGAGGSHDDPSFADITDEEEVEKLLASCGVPAEFKQLVHGRSPAEEILHLVEAEHASLVVNGLRKRSPVGKLLLGSTAQDILFSVPCPVLAVKAD